LLVIIHNYTSDAWTHERQISWFDSRPAVHCAFPYSFKKILGYSRTTGQVLSLPRTFEFITYIYSLICLCKTFAADNPPLNRGGKKLVTVVEYILCTNHVLRMSEEIKQ